MTRANVWSLAIVGLVVSSVAAGVGQTPQSSSQALPLSPARRAQMEHHFSQASRVLEAAIRGDLAAVKGPASELSVIPAPSGMPPAAAPFVEFIRLQGRRAVAAATLDHAAEAAASMLTLCGDCHRTAGVSVAPVASDRPDVGGMVGHMLEHQRAIDEMVEGLISPSPARFRTGASRLRAAPLQPDNLPPDPRLTAEIRQAEGRVHEIGAEAEAAETATARTAAFSKLIATCSSCHSLHPRIWGPDSSGRGPGQ
jgi:cytochrome c553